MSNEQIVNEVKRRRTFAIISHPDAGKTTLTEKLLLFSGAIQIAGSVKARKASRHATSDWMEIEKQRGISVASSVMQMEYRDCVINLLDTPGHQDFSRRHLPRADRGGRGADGHRRSQRRRAADAAAAAGVPRAQYADPDLRQQDGPRGQGAAGPVRRDRVRAGHERGALHLAGGHGQGLRRRARPAARPDARVLAGRRPGQGCRRDHRRHRQPGAGRALRHGLRAGRRRGAAGARGRAGLRRGRVPGRATDTDVLRQRHQQLRRPGGAGRPGRAGAAAGPEGRAAARGAAHRAQVQRRGIQDPGQHGPGAPRPHRLPARGQRPLRARHAAEGGAQRQGAAAEHRGLLPEPEARAAGRSLRRRHHRHPQPRRAAARRHAHRGRGAAVHRAALLRAGDVPLGGSGRPAAHQAVARRPDAAGRGRRDPGLPSGGRQHAAARRGGAAAVRGRRAPAGA